MTLQHHLKISCVDNLENYTYDLIHKGKVVKTIDSDEEFKYGLVTISGDKFDLDLFETHSDLVKRADFSDPSIYVITITSN